MNISNREANSIAWHYTIGHVLDEIFKCGYLKQATSGISRHEKPVLWFSTHQYFEPTARKGKCTSDAITDNGDGTFSINPSKVETMSVEEMKEKSGGLFRFGYPLKKLHNWEKLQKVAKIPAIIAKGLEEVTREQGGDVNQWYGTTKKIFLPDIVSFQIMVEGNWTDIDQKYFSPGYFEEEAA